MRKESVLAIVMVVLGMALIYRSMHNQSTFNLPKKVARLEISSGAIDSDALNSSTEAQATDDQTITEELPVSEFKPDTSKSIRNHYLKCLQDTDSPCAEFDKSSPRAYLSDVLAQTLAQVRAVRANEISSLAKTYGNQLPVSEIEGLAFDLLDSGYADLQIEALELLKLVPFQSSQGKKLMDAFEVSLDETFAEESLKFAQERMSPEELYGATVQRAMLAQISTGISESVAEITAKNIYSVLNRENFERYKRLSDKLNPNLRRTKALRQALEEFEKFKSNSI